MISITPSLLKNEMAAFDPFLKSKLRQNMPQITKIDIVIRRPAKHRLQHVVKSTHGEL